VFCPFGMYQGRACVTMGWGLSASNADLNTGMAGNRMTTWSQLSLCRHAAYNYLSACNILW
jgi:hypothetical protein